MKKSAKAKTPIDRAYVRATPFLTAEQQIQELLAWPVPERAIYVQGRGPEDLPELIKAARQDEIIGLVTGYRILGDNRKQIMAAVVELKKRKKAILFDTRIGERSDRDGDIMLDRALRRIHGEEHLGDAETAAELGALGGRAKARKMRKNRMSRREARKIWFRTDLTIAQKVELMGPGWSKSVCIRPPSKGGFGPCGRKSGPIASED